MTLWQVIHNENLDNMITPVCLDSMPPKDLMSLNVKQVPTIVVCCENQQPVIHEGPMRCSKWLTNFTINRRQNLARHVEQQMRLIQKTHSIARTQEGGPIEYTESEMDGISDSYSYNNTDLSQPKSFVMIGEEENYCIRTPQINNEEKIDTNKMMQSLNELEKSRQNDNQQFMNTMERNQIKAVINYNPY